jgi:hypothetical protein
MIAVALAALSFGPAAAKPDRHLDVRAPYITIAPATFAPGATIHGTVDFNGPMYWISGPACNGGSIRPSYDLTVVRLDSAGKPVANSGGVGSGVTYERVEANVHKTLQFPDFLIPDAAGGSGRIRVIASLNYTQYRIIPAPGGQNVCKADGVSRVIATKDFQLRCGKTPAERCRYTPG